MEDDVPHARPRVRRRTPCYMGTPFCLVLTSLFCFIFTVLSIIGIVLCAHAAHELDNGWTRVPCRAERIEAAEADQTCVYFAATAHGHRSACGVPSDLAQRGRWDASPSCFPRDDTIAPDVAYWDDVTQNGPINTTCLFPDDPVPAAKCSTAAVIGGRIETYFRAWSTRLVYLERRPGDGHVAIERAIAPIKHTGIALLGVAVLFFLLTVGMIFFGQCLDVLEQITTRLRDFNDELLISQYPKIE